MSSDGIAIRVNNIGKGYQIYDKPRDRLKQFVLPRLCRMLGLSFDQYYREFSALKGVSFDIAKGETVGIIGRNGSGKSTLLQVICGTLTPSMGTVETNGRIAALLELGAGFNPEFTGRENVYMNAAVLGLSREEVDARYERIIAFADIGDFVEQPVKAYSSGMVVRLAFAVAVNVDPDILIIDEALSVGDELFQRKCFSRIEAIKKAGATILFVSHSGSTIVELCDRAVLMESGEKLAIGTPKQIVGWYQKLLYAPQDKYIVTREKIRQKEDNAWSLIEESHDSIELPYQTVEDSNELVESYDPNLKPSSTIEYESHGALIESPCITMLNGEKVNNLVNGGVYCYLYKVRFAKSANNVRFGMLIKTIEGVELGGGTSAAPGYQGLDVVAGTVYNVEFRFNCALNPGVYFLNAGVLGDTNGVDTYLHRLIDIAMFRVQLNSIRLATGIVDFCCHAKIDEQKK